MTNASLSLKLIPAAMAALLLIAGCSSGGSNETVSGEGWTPKPSQEGDTYDKESVLDAAKGVFGEGAEGLAELIEKAFADNGRPNGYIVGEEVGGGLVVGLRYGSGTLHHKIEGQRPVHWTGPSIGFEIGADAAKVFTLVYNLYDTEQVYQRFPAVEGQLYFIGGMGMNYMQSDNIRIAQIRLGVGLRGTANVGYIKFTKKRTFVPL